jgi:hypothetical protein
MHRDRACDELRSAEAEKGVIREENYHVRCVTQSGFHSLGEVGS